MNKYLVCFSVLAVSFCLVGAVTKYELERLIHKVNSEVRVEEIIAIKNHTRDAMAEATTPQQKICITTKIGPAYRDLNLALTRELIAVQTEYRALSEQTEEMDPDTLSSKLYERFIGASTAQDSIEQIYQC